MEQVTQPIDELLGPGADREVYGAAYDRCVRDVREILRKMSSAVGWKGTKVPFDFTGFSGYWPDITPDGVDICHGPEVIGTFYPKDDGALGFEACGEELAWTRDSSPWEVLEDFRRGLLFGSVENIRQARSELHGGRCIVYGLSYGDAVAYVAPEGDDLLRRLLAATGSNVRFTSPDVLSDALDRYIRANAVPGFESERIPQVVRYIYDGLTLSSEKEVSVGVDRNCGRGYPSDWTAIDMLRHEGEKMRREFEREAGVPEGRHFRFGEAVYPTLGIRDDALFLTSRYGSALGDFVTCSKGGVCLYRDYDPDRGLSAPAVRFKGIDDAIASLRKVVFSERNLGVAKKEYLSFSRRQAKGVRP